MSALGGSAKNVTYRKFFRGRRYSSSLYVSFRKETCIGSETDVTHADFLRLLSYFILYYFIKNDEGKGINRVSITRDNCLRTKRQIMQNWSNLMIQFYH